MTNFVSAMYIIFLNVPGSPFNNPVEAVMCMFMMSLGEFGDYYESFSQTNHPILSKVGDTTLYWLLSPLIFLLFNINPEC